MRIFLNQAVNKFAKRHKIEDWQIEKAIRDAEIGIIDADLGSGLIKQRIARPNEGKSGGYRSIIFFKLGDLAIFLYSFAKNEKENISESDLLLLREVAKSIAEMDQAALLDHLANGRFREVEHHGKSL